MSILNEKTEETSKKIHLMVTNLCSRHCPNCCNKCYSLDDIPLVTEEELKNCETLFLTGGEPFEFCDVDALAKYYKKHYLNIENVIVYGNVTEFFAYLMKGGKIHHLDGLSLSIKNGQDLEDWNEFLFPDLKEYPNFFESLVHNRLYNFLNDGELKASEKFPVIKRKWVNLKEWKPADDSIFRRAF